MSGTFPTAILPQKFSLINKRPTITNQSVSGKRVARKYGSQYFMLEVGHGPLGVNNGLGIYGFLQQQQGAFEKFSYKYPLPNRGQAGVLPYGPIPTDITAEVSGAHSVGDSSVDIDTFNVIATGGDLLKRGDIVKFAGSDKIYMIKSDVTMPSSTSDTKTLEIEPPLTDALSNNASVTLNQPKFQVYLTDDIVFDTDANGLYYISFTLRECIE